MHWVQKNSSPVFDEIYITNQKLLNIAFRNATIVAHSVVTTISLQENVTFKTLQHEFFKI